MTRTMLARLFNAVRFFSQVTGKEEMNNEENDIILISMRPNIDLVFLFFAFRQYVSLTLEM